MVPDNISHSHSLFTPGLTSFARQIFLHELEGFFPEYLNSWLYSPWVFNQGRTKKACFKHTYVGPYFPKCIFSIPCKLILWAFKRYIFPYFLYATVLPASEIWQLLKAAKIVWGLPSIIYRPIWHYGHMSPELHPL